MLLVEDMIFNHEFFDSKEVLIFRNFAYEKGDRFHRYFS